MITEKIDNLLNSGIDENIGLAIAIIVENKKPVKELSTEEIKTSFYALTIPFLKTEKIKELHIPYEEYKSYVSEIRIAFHKNNST